MTGRGIHISLDCCIRMLYSHGIGQCMWWEQKEDDMSVLTTVRLEDTVRRRVEARARAHRRSLSEQMKYYVFLGMLAEENPDLPLAFIQDLLEGKEEAKARLAVPYEWGVLR